MGRWFLRRGGRLFFTRERGSMVLEGVLVLPVVLVLLFFVVSVFNFFSLSSFLRHRVDSFGTYIASVGSVDVSVGGLEVVDFTRLVSGELARGYLLEGGVLKEEALVVETVLEGGYLFVEVEYRMGVFLYGVVVIRECYERRLWS